MIVSNDFQLSKYGLNVRLIRPDDASFILSLRTDPDLNQFIHSTSPCVDDQIKWIYKYKERECVGLDYYLIYSINDKPIGAERIYDIDNDSFKIGSLIFSKEAPFGSAIIGDIITREIGFDTLGLPKNYFEVMKGNKGVNYYHLRYRPLLIMEDEEQFYYELSKDNFNKYKKLYLKMFNCL